LGSRTQDCSLHENNFLEAEAIAETVDRENMRFVSIKTDDRLDLRALHRVRDRLFRPACQRLRQIPGIDPLVAIAIMAAIGNGGAFQPHDLASRQNRILPSTTAKGPKP
jgi:transposase